MSQELSDTPPAEHAEHEKQSETENQSETKETAKLEKPAAGAEATTSTSMNLKWKVVGKCPHTIQKWGSEAILVGSTVYIQDLLGEGIYTYNYEKDTWSTIPYPPNRVGTLVLVKNLLTSLGGGSNKLFSFTGEGKEKKWAEVFTPMPTARQSVMACSNDKLLIVAGGDKGKKVEVMDIETQQWSTAANLPENISGCSLTIHGSDDIYLMGGDTFSVYTCSLSDLVEQKSFGAKLASALSLSKTWRKLANLPVARATAVSFNGRLLAIGGTAADASTVAVRMYESGKNTWKIISHMTQPRNLCFAVVLPDNTLLVLGGRGPEYCIGYIHETERASIM